VINPDHILSTVWAKLNEDTTFKARVPHVVKGAKRPESYAKKPSAPSATVNLLTAPIDGETDAMRCTVTINVYVADHSNGQMDSKSLGEAASLVTKLFHKNYNLKHPDLVFKSVLVQEPLIGLKGEFEGEHFASIKIRMIVKAKGGK
jgi:hypothetical protein